MRSQNRNCGIINSGEIRPESENTCYQNLPNRPVLLRDGRRNKSALRRRDIPATVVARFHAKYQKSDGCWLWTAGKYFHGYGQITLGRDYSGRQHNTYAHRLAYVLAHGDIPQGRVVMHSCDTPACVNPAHLILGDQAENIRDAARKGKYGGPCVKRQKVTNAQVAEIRASNETLAVLATRYGVSRVHVYFIRRGLRRAS